MSLILILAFFRNLRKEMMEKPEEKEITWRQLFIKITALSITFIIGFMFLGAMDYVISLVS